MQILCLWSNFKVATYGHAYVTFFNIFKKNPFPPPMRKPNLIPVILLFLIAILTLPCYVTGQPLNTSLQGLSPIEKYYVTVENIRTEAGLTANIISNGIRDHRGFLWTPTPNGLARFDGEDFLDLGRDKNHLQGNAVFTLAEDEKGFIWLLYLIPGTGSSSSGKIDLLDTRTLLARPAIEVYPALNNLDGIVIAVFTDPDQTIFLETSKGSVYRKTPDGNFKLLISRPIQTPGQAKNRVIAGKKHLWFLPNDSTAYCIHSDNNKIIELKNNQDTYLQPLQIDADENLLVLKGSVSEKKLLPEIFLFTAEGKIISRGEYLAGKTKVITRITPIIRSAKQLDGEDIIISHPDEGIFLRKSNGNHILLMGKDEMKMYPDLITSHPIFSDPNTCWFFSQTAGLFKITFRPARFTNYLGRASLPAGLHQEYCQARGIYEDPNEKLYVNSWLGILIVDIKNPSATPRPVYPNTNGLCIHVFDSVIYTFNTVLTAHNPELKPKYLFYKKNDKSPGNIWSMFKSSNGRLWLGTENGLAFTDDIHHEIEDYKYNDGLDHRNQFVYQIVKDSNGELWAATSTGLINFNETGDGCRLYNRSGKGQYKLPLEDIFTIYEDGEKNFWIGTNGNGLVKWNRATGKTETFTMAEGLSSNVIYGILGETGAGNKKENLWMSSTFGLMCFNTGDNSIRTYTQKDGLAFNEFNRSSYYKSNSGKFYFGGIDGVTSFNPSDFLNENKIPDSQIQILAFNQFISATNTLTDLTGELLQSNAIVMKPGDRFFTLRFRLMNFEKEKPSYAYKFDGYDAGWNYINENSIRISNLPSGNYTLRIKAQNHQGKWSTNELTIPVTVLVPFYRNPFVLTGFSLMLAAIAFGFYKWNNRKLKQEKEKLELEVAKRTEKIEQQKTQLLEMDKLKSRFFANISHELRTPLTLITGPVDAMLHGQYGELSPNLKNALTRTEKNGKQLMRFIEQILDLSRLESGKLLIYEKPVLLASEIRKIESSFKELARIKHQEWEVEYLLPDDLIVMLDDDKLEKIIYNLLSNAFKFTQQFGKVKMTVKPLKVADFDLNSNSKFDIVFEVTDTGKGIPLEDQPFIFDRFFQSSKMEESNTGGSGIGLAFAKELTHAFHGELTAISEHGKGSTFRLILPLRKALIEAQTEAVSDESILGIIPARLTDSGENGIQLLKAHTILLVDDNYDLLQFISEVLSPLYKVITASNGIEAIKHLESKNLPIDFIISDVMMPHMDGFEFLEKLKSHPEWKRLPVILLTAKATTEHKIRALRIGVDDYMYKPFSTAELLARVQNLLHHYENRNEVPFVETTPIIQNDSNTQLNDPEATYKNYISEYDLNWLEKAETICKSNISNTLFSLPDLADKLALSERQLHRRINALTGLTPNKYIREIKLQFARELLEAGRFKTVAEVAYHVAFEKPDYFSKLFSERFGVKPSELLR